MFAIPGVCALITFIYVRPQEIFPVMMKVPFLYLFFALAVLGLAIDLRLRVVKPIATPQLFWVLLLWVWMLITVALKRPEWFSLKLTELTILVILYVVIAQGLQSFRGIELVTGVLVVLLFFLTAVGIHLGFAPKGCVTYEHELGSAILIPDGRACEQERRCYEGDSEPGKDYRCEHVGLFGVTSVGGGRVRYRGVLQDPNELALATGCALAFAFAFVANRRSRKRTFLLCAAVVMVGICTVLTRSRGGQLVFLAVIGTYFVRRFGAKGMALGVMLAAPLLLLGGRGGAEASESTMERYEAWVEGFNLFRNSPLVGVGQGGFTDHHYRTAHNAYVLALSELGIPGFVLWAIVMYISMKILVVGVRRYAGVPEARVAFNWALALLASMIGMLIGITFLSFSYHYVLWIYLGLCGAYYSAARSHDPGLRVRFRWTELAGIMVGSTIFFAILKVYVARKTGT